MNADNTEAEGVDRRGDEGGEEVQVSADADEREASRSGHAYFGRVQPESQLTGSFGELTRVPASIPQRFRRRSASVSGQRATYTEGALFSLSGLRRPQTS